MRLILIFRALAAAAASAMAPMPAPTTATIRALALSFAGALLPVARRSLASFAGFRRLDDVALEGL
jgi:hypothetical protein